MSGEIEELERWYEAQCDGDWEHEFGPRIETIDNPGWSINIPLEGTPLDGRPFTSVELRESDRTWMFCRVSENSFRGSGGPLMLGRMLRVFLDWARAEQGKPDVVAP